MQIQLLKPSLTGLFLIASLAGCEAPPKDEAPAVAASATPAAATAVSAVRPAPAPPGKYAAKVPAQIQTPDTVETRIGTLRFFDGAPDEETVKKVYDQLDFSRGVETFMAGMPAASVYALCEGLDSIGAPRNGGIGISETLADAGALFLTPNTTVVYAWACVDLKAGPMVLELASKSLGIMDDAYFRFVTDLGMNGPDQGKGGKYLMVPPGDETVGEKAGYFVQKPRTFGNLLIIRAFVKDGDVAGTVKHLKEHTKIYPLAEAAKAPETKFVNISGNQFNTVHANDFHFYEELDAVVQHEPEGFVEPETVGLFSAIGIKKGKPFAPDARMKGILTDAVAVANATARAIVFAPRDERAKTYPDQHWITGFIKGSHDFADGAERMLDARTRFLYYATGTSPSMSSPKVGKGAAYAYTTRDSQGRYLDGSKTYKITLKAPVPAAAFWSITVYDNQTRSLIETDQKLAALDSTLPALKKNEDGSVTVWFAAKAPAGQEGNWIQTRSGKGWNAILRLYSPLEPWFDQSWKPGDIELVE